MSGGAYSETQSSMAAQPHIHACQLCRSLQLILEGDIVIISGVMDDGEALAYFPSLWNPGMRHPHTRPIFELNSFLGSSEYQVRFAEFWFCLVISMELFLCPQGSDSTL
jgi:hypothetical protein